MDVEAYLQRIGYAGPREPSHAVLGELVLRHALSIPFENLDPYLARGVSLEPAQVERKLVAQRRGGWCFEHNLLLGEVLRALGFAVTDLAGRVLWGRPPDAITARTHRLLLVRAGGREWLADAGFGGHTLTGVLDLHSELAQETPHEPFRLRPIGGGERVLESLVAGEWRALFRFDLHPQLPIDFEAANFQLVHDPASHFTQGLIATRVAPDGRHVLRGRELAFHRLGGDTTRRELTNEATVAALGEVFGIAVDAPLRELLRRRLEPAR